MMKKIICTMLAAVMIFALCACSTTKKEESAETTSATEAESVDNTVTTEAEPENNTSAVEAEPAGNALTVDVYNTGERFLPFFAYVKDLYPDIELSITTFRGANGSEYSNNVLEHGDQGDIYFTSRNECKDEACRENLIDLSGYEFVSKLSQSILDTISVDGEIYLLPIQNTVYGIAYNKTLLEEMDAELPQNYDDLVALKEKCDERGIKLCVMSGKLPGGLFQVVTNIAQMNFLDTPDGAAWEKAFLAGEDVDYSVWDDTLAYMQKLIDIGFFELVEENPLSTSTENGLYSGNTLFAISQSSFNPDGGKDVTDDEFGLMPFISEDGSANYYIYNPGSFIGISNELLEEGNEEKLENALKILELYATELGQEALNYNADVFPILKDSNVDSGSPLYDAYNASLEGRMERLKYTTWNEYGLITPVGDAFKNWILGEGDGQGIIDAMKEIRQEAKEQGGAPVYCTCDSDLTLEESARIVGGVYAKMAGTDVALMSLGETHVGELKEYEIDGRTCSITGLNVNPYGVNGIFYEGNITQEDSWVALPGTYSNTDSIAILHLTGAQLKELVENGFDQYGDGDIYQYVISVRDGKELDDDTVYEVATVPGNYTEELAELGSVEFIDVDDFLNVFTETLGSYETLSKDMTL